MASEAIIICQFFSCYHFLLGSSRLLTKIMQGHKRKSHKTKSVCRTKQMLAIDRKWLLAEALLSWLGQALILNISQGNKKLGMLNINVIYWGEMWSCPIVYNKSVWLIFIYLVKGYTTGLEEHSRSLPKRSTIPDHRLCRIAAQLQ